jgi:hypothetical protein
MLNQRPYHESRRGRCRPSVVVFTAVLGLLFLSLLGVGCGSGQDTDGQLAQQQALREARRQGAQSARLNGRIKRLEHQVKHQRQSSQDSPAWASTGSETTATSYVASYAPYQPSDPSYAYTAEIPSGGGWSAPVESHPTSGLLLRTSLRGPDGTLLIIDRTPQDVPDLGGTYDAVRTTSQPSFGQATEYVFSRSEALADCNGRPCVDFLINDGSGGGWGVLAGGPNPSVAEGIASHVAQSISFGDY